MDDMEGLSTADGDFISPFVNSNDYDGNQSDWKNSLLNNLFSTVECLKSELKEKNSIIDRLLSLLERDVETTNERSSSCDDSSTSSVFTESHKSCDTSSVFTESHKSCDTSSVFTESHKSCDTSSVFTESHKSCDTSSVFTESHKSCDTSSVFTESHKSCDTSSVFTESHKSCDTSSVFTESHKSCDTSSVFTESHKSCDTSSVFTESHKSCDTSSVFTESHKSCDTSSVFTESHKSCDTSSVFTESHKSCDTSSVFTESHKSCDNNLYNEFNQFCFDNVTLRNKYIHVYVTSEASSEFLLQDQLKNIRAIQHKKFTEVKYKDDVNRVILSSNTHTTDSNNNPHIRNMSSPPRPPNPSGKRAWKRNTLLIVGDSTSNGIQESKMSSNDSIKVRSFSGAMVNDFITI